MVGQTIRVSRGKVVEYWKIYDEAFEHGQRIYKAIDQDGVERTALADIIDRDYNTPKQGERPKRRSFQAKYREKWKH
ncbi:hypothetical protein [Chitinophaga sp. sic0106]|uniref:hypothetical protein n=1 Tax=Chitinophaga sp. sic0106 TaxID=2854785 RepID=UPI001C462F8E|nr:hypothetical protein [Chitinophaga sp. sic0106]MBV7531318.1 hypothetical protein [Chitinophaga sp. sic0106]